MAMMNQMNHPDPSFSVPQDLMPHVHLVSSRRYPQVAHVNLNDVASWLMQAPLIARDKAPFCWQFLDKPADGTVLMTWQPLQRLATSFATDGYIWAPPEQLYKHDLGNGLILEIYYLKAGYAPPQEQYAAHARRRFRLVPVSGHANPNTPQPDPNLFIVHWGPSEPNDTIPANMVPYDQRLHNAMQQRQFLLKAGHIRRKEFMLSDRANWPTLPELTGRPMEPQMAPRGVPQHMAYPPQGVAGPPAKRARHASNAAQQPPVPGMPPIEPTFDDDEDTSRGDMFDHMIPREISLARYQQNHEWMEEILSSPYRINQITPADLNLGLMGDLASLTEGIFTAQGGDAYSKVPDESKAYVGRLDPEKADEFRKRVDDHIASEKAQMEKMKEEHEAAMADMKQKSILNTKEKQLRSLEDAGSELWMPHDGGELKSEGLKTTVEEIIQEIESSTGRKIESQPAVKCVQEGGWQAPAPEPVAPPQPPQMSRQPSQSGSQNSGIMIGESDIDMGGTAAGLLDQMGTGLSPHSTPANFPTPQAQLSAVQSSAATPQNANVGSPAVGQPPAQQPQPATSGDVTMGGTDAAPKEQSGTAPDQGTGSGDWVVVPKDGTPDVGAPAAATTAASASDANTPKPTAASVKPVSAAATPAITDGDFDQNDFSSLGDLDTAGDALAGFDTPALDGSAGELGEGLDLQMDMEDSAFGDAFHGVDTTGTPGQDM
ncbi:hypothetical protein ACO1O0_000489 [Amphichorda felina]